MKKLTSIIFLITLLLFSASCQRWVADLFFDRPDKEFKEDLKDASVEFQQGWRDGCETGMSSANSTFYKSFYRGATADGYKMTSSADYKTAWGNAFWYCYRIDWVKQKNTKVWSTTFGGLK
jgi:hypothetical protein